MTRRLGDGRSERAGWRYSQDVGMVGCERLG
jgi:hypothetical protein